MLHKLHQSECNCLDLSRKATYIHKKRRFNQDSSKFRPSGSYCTSYNMTMQTLAAWSIHSWMEFANQVEELDLHNCTNSLHNTLSVNLRLMHNHAHLLNGIIHRAPNKTILWNVTRFFSASANALAYWAWASANSLCITLWYQARTSDAKAVTRTDELIHSYKAILWHDAPLLRFSRWMHFVMLSATTSPDSRAGN